MAGNVPFKPEGYHTVTPYLIVRDVEGLIAFMEKVFDAKLGQHMKGPDGRVIHAEVRIGDSLIMMGGSTELFPPFPGMLHLYIEDTDGVYKQAVKAGGISLQDPQDQFYGDRTAGFKDIFGNQWWLATHIEDVSADELERRAAARSS